eukprot:3667920-Rhodomonas_salina.4
MRSSLSTQCNGTSSMFQKFAQTSLHGPSKQSPMAPFRRRRRMPSVWSLLLGRGSVGSGLHFFDGGSA